MLDCASAPLIDFASHGPLPTPSETYYCDDPRVSENIKIKEVVMEMTDVSTCSAGTLFCGHRRRITQGSGWWSEAQPHSPSTTVDATKIRLICLYLSQHHQSGANGGSFNGLPGIESRDAFSEVVPLDTPTLPRRTARQQLHSNFQRLSPRQFWLNFVVNENVTLGEVNFEICKHFCRIPFHHWIQAALGHRSEAIDDLFTSVAMIRHKYGKLWERSERGSRVRSLPNLKHLHPLTYGVFNELSDPLLPMERVEFVLEPIRTVIRTSPKSHLSQRLIILGLRFETTYIRPALVDWSLKLSTDFDIVQDLAYDGPKALAKTITKTDVETFKNITMDDLKSGTDTRADLRWHQISRIAEEAVVSCPVLCKLVSELAKNLYSLRNYFSMTAVLAGAHSAAVHFPFAFTALDDLSELSNFLREENNYAYCRVHTIRNGGLPWLSPFRMACREHRKSDRSSDGVITMANLMLQILTYSRFYAVRPKTLL